MSTIRLTRLKDEFNSDCDVDIYINGIKIGAVSNCESKEFNVKAEEFKLMAKIDWCGSEILPVKINDGETKDYIISSFSKGRRILTNAKKISVFGFGMLFLLTFFGRTLFVWFGDWLILLGLPVCIPILVFLYFLTIGRNKYLVLKESEED